MKSYLVEKESQQKSAIAPSSKNLQAAGFQDNRPSTALQMKLQSAADESPQVQKAAKMQALADNYTSRGIFQKKENTNNTGLPDNLKSGIENLSGYAMNDVKVHYNSDKPAQLQAHAYAQGTDIHLAPGQEKHLPHEAWHVVQQKQGRVKPTMQMKGKVNVNDDKALEREADVMGAKALQVKNKTNSLIENTSNINNSEPVLQGHFGWFKGLFEKQEPEFVPKTDATAFTDEKAKQINKSMKVAHEMVQKAKGKVSKDNRRYKKFMDAGLIDKQGQDARVQHVKDGFEKVENVLLNDMLTFKKFEPKHKNEESTFAYVYTGANKREIYLGGAFWGAKVKGYDSKAGTIIHELTHEVHGTLDHEYGIENSKKLAKTDPAKATTNADNYEHFAEKA